MGLVCPVCRRRVRRARVVETETRAFFAGFVEYGICRCGMEADDPQNPLYRRRWRKAFRRAFSGSGPGVKRRNSVSEGERS